MLNLFLSGLFLAGIESQVFLPITTAFCFSGGTQFTITHSVFCIIHCMKVCFALCMKVCSLLYTLYEVCSLHTVLSALHTV